MGHLVSRGTITPNSRRRASPKQHNSFCASQIRPIVSHMTRPAKPYRSRKLGNRPLSPETLMMGFGYDAALSLLKELKDTKGLSLGLFEIYRDIFFVPMDSFGSDSS